VDHQSLAAICPLGVDAVELTHPLGEVRIRRLDDEVIVVGHLAIGVAARIETAAHLTKDGEPLRPVQIVATDRLAPITVPGDVIEPTGALHTERSGYSAEHSSEMRASKTWPFRPAESRELFGCDRVLDAVSTLSDVECPRGVHCGKYLYGSE